MGLLNLRAADTVVTNQVGQGVVFRHYHYDNLDGGKQEVYIMDVNLNDPAVSLKIPYLNAGRTVTAHAGTVSGAAAAVNGQFFNSGGSIDFLRVNGSVIYPSQTGVHDEQALTDDGLGHTNSIGIALRPGGEGALTWTNLATSNIMSCGVALVSNGALVTNYDSNDPYITQANPRTCAAWTTNNHLLLLCVDGRTVNAAGMTIPQLRDYVFAVGKIRHSFGFDGGGSTTMWARGIGVCNVPSDGVQRAVADAAVIVAAAPAVPAPPLNLSAIATGTNILLSWSLSSGAMTYNLKRSATIGGTYTNITTVVETTWTNTALPMGTTFYYAVSAVNSKGESSNSIVASATTIPPTPTNVLAFAGDRQVTLTWNAPGATNYKISRSIVSGSGYTLIANVPVNSFTNTGLGNGVTYYYMISAANAAGSTGNSTEVSATPMCPALVPPQGLTATAAGGAITLNWQATSGAQNYGIQRAIFPGGPFSPLTNGLAVTNYVDHTTLPGTVYFYTVTASNTCNASPSSLEVSAPLLITSSLITSTNWIMGGWGGLPGSGYCVLSSTNIDAPVATWSKSMSNTFGAAGEFRFTNAFDSTEPQRFFSIQSTP